MKRFGYLAGRYPTLFLSPCFSRPVSQTRSAQMHLFEARLQWRAGLILLILFGLNDPLYAQNQRVEPDGVLTLERISGSVDIDGQMDEAAWASLEPFPLTVYEPVYREPMTERTEIRIGYDDQFLYVAGWLYDEEPGNIRANSMYRDLYSGDDTFSIFLDTFNDQENGLWFMTTPNGVRLDMAISNDLQGGGSNPFGRVVNQSWNTYWDVVTSRNEQGWFAEMRIPFSSLGFQDDDGVVEMGMSVMRYISRKNERHIYPDTPPNWNMSYAKPSQYKRVRASRTREANGRSTLPRILPEACRKSMISTMRKRHTSNRMTLPVMWGLTSSTT